MSQQLISALASLTSLLTTAAFALGTPAGTRIDNQAFVTYTHEGRHYKFSSNVVTTEVLALCSLSLTRTGSAAPRTGYAGEQFVFPYTLTNTGNARFELPVSANITGATATIYHDKNKNNQPDPGEQITTTVSLAADEQAPLLVVVDTAGGLANAASLALELTATCAAGAQAVTSKERIDLNPAPTITITKRFAPTAIKPGEMTHVALSTTNNSGTATREVVLFDPLAELRAKGLLFAGNAKASKDALIEYTTAPDPKDPKAIWSKDLPVDVAAVTGIRAKQSTLASRESLTLDFDMRAVTTADKQDLLNVATVSSSGKVTEGRDTLSITFNPSVKIGPLGDPEATGDNDVQRKPVVLVGEEVCFDHTLKNTGDIVDEYTITVSYPNSATQPKFSLKTLSGDALVTPIKLDPGQTAPVRVCYQIADKGAMDALIEAKGKRGSQDPTQDILGNTVAGLPQLEKFATITDAAGQKVTFKENKDGEKGKVKVADEIEYTLKVTNAYESALTNLEITDPLPKDVAYVEGSASVGGVLQTNANGNPELVWKVPTLAAGASLELTFKAKVKDTAKDGDVITNLFKMVTTELPKRTLESNPVETPIWTGSEKVDFKINKKVDPLIATVGQALTYTLTITNPSQTTPILDVDIEDTPTIGLDYIKGTTMINGKVGAEPVANPDVEHGLIWEKIGTLKPGESITLVYKMRLTPLAPQGQPIPNSVLAFGKGGVNKRTKVASNKSKADVRNELMQFAPLGDILGTVYIDRNRNGLFDKDLDTPVERARIILSNGRLALTDARGRYHFAQVPYGSWALRLDPTTTPYEPLILPQEGGLKGTQTVHVRGLTTVDFPLAPVGGDIGVKRTTTLKVGDVTVAKEVFEQEGGYRVTLKINTPRDLKEVQLNDPLPQGAILKSGQNTLTGDLKAGSTELTYFIVYAPNAQASVVTDPTISWRY